VSGPIALLLPGQGAQHQGMAVELYGRDLVFTRTVDEFFGHMGAAGQALRADWLTDRPAVVLDDASRAQPLLFVIGYALGRSLLDRGLRPAVLLGHSVGELAAAALAGVFDLAEAAAIMLARSAAMRSAPAGGLLAVAAIPADLELYLGDGVVIGALNAPRQTVLAGPEPRLSVVENMLRDNRVSCRRVPARQPFHCPAVAPAAACFEAALRDVRLRPNMMPIVSTRTAEPVRASQALDPEFWAGQLAEPVLFWPALDALLRTGGFTLVEAGPGQGLSMLAARHPAVRAHRSRVLALLPSAAEGTLATWSAAVEQLIFD
jgi:[acyl-carrier-protein] S-malonyltransferase